MKLFVDNNESKTIILSDSQVARLSEAADKYFSSNDLEGMSSSSEVITKPRSGNRKEHETRISHFKALKDYCVNHLGKPIASGSSRLVFQIDDEKVLKLAYNSAGIAQNKEEALWDKQQYNFRQGLTRTRRANVFFRTISGKSKYGVSTITHHIFI